MEELWGVVIGGIIAIVGGAVSPLIQHRLTRAAKESDERTAAVQALIFAVHEHREWADKLRENLVWDMGHELGPNPLPKIQSTIAVHFPDLTSSIQLLELADAKQKVWATARKQERLSGIAMDISGWGEVYKEYLLAAENIVSAVSGRRIMTIEEIWPTEPGAAGND